MTDFSAAVINCISKIPAGRVATYGQIAEACGKPHAARGVSWILNSSSKKYKLPWHRVLGSGGKISFPKMSSNFLRQKKKLLLEGVEISEMGLADLKLYQWKISAAAARSFALHASKRDI